MFNRDRAPSPGDAAPTFKLEADDGSTFELKPLRGLKRVILAFYPEDDTPG